jgi:hypothetical protein
MNEERTFPIMRVSLIVSNFEETYRLIILKIETMHSLTVIMKQFTGNNFSSFHNSRTKHNEFDNHKL